MFDFFQAEKKIYGLASMGQKALSLYREDNQQIESLDKAYFCFKKAIQITSKCDFLKDIDYANLGLAYLGLGWIAKNGLNTDSAIYCYTMAIELISCRAKQSVSLPLYSECYYYLALCYPHGSDEMRLCQLAQQLFSGSVILPNDDRSLELNGIIKILQDQESPSAMLWQLLRLTYSATALRGFPDCRFKEEVAVKPKADVIEDFLRSTEKKFAQQLSIDFSKINELKIHTMQEIKVDRSPLNKMNTVQEDEVDDDLLARLHYFRPGS